MKTGIVFGSTTGNTENIAGQISALIDGSTVTAVEDVASADYEEYDLLILGASTWGFGDLQDDFNDNLDNLRNAKLEGKKVALFGLGDQAAYPDTFVDGIKFVHDAALEAGATVVGKCADEGYDYADSAAIEDGQFLGLPIDFENQSDMIDDRLQNWVKQIQDEVAG